jgi:hypothetical protein
MQQDILNAFGDRLSSLAGISGVYPVYCDTAPKFPSTEPYLVYRVQNDVPDKYFTDENQHLYIAVDIYCKLNVGTVLPRSLANIVYNGVHHFFASVSGTNDVEFCPKSKGIATSDGDYYRYTISDIEVYSHDA